MNSGFYQIFLKMFNKKDRFFPLVSFLKSSDGWMAHIIRIILIGLTIAYVIYLRTNPDLMSELQEVGLKTHDDLKAWGINKISFNFTNINKNSLIHENIVEEAADNKENDIIQPSEVQNESYDYAETL